MEHDRCPIDLERAMKEFEADREFLRELLGGFLQNVRKQIEAIGRAMEEQNADAVRREAHAIKGGAANICADGLSRAASELEILGRSGNLQGGSVMLRKLEQECIRLENFDKTE